MLSLFHYYIKNVSTSKNRLSINPSQIPLFAFSISIHLKIIKNILYMISYNMLTLLFFALMKGI